MGVRRVHALGPGLDAFAWTIFAAEWRKLHGYAETTCTVGERLEDFPGDVTTYRPDMRIDYTVGGREYETWTYEFTFAAGLNRRASQEALDPFALNGAIPAGTTRPIRARSSWSAAMPASPGFSSQPPRS